MSHPEFDLFLMRPPPPLLPPQDNHSRSFLAVKYSMAIKVSWGTFCYLELNVPLTRSRSDVKRASNSDSRKRVESLISEGSKVMSSKSKEFILPGVMAAATGNVWFLTCLYIFEASAWSMCTPVFMAFGSNICNSVVGGGFVNIRIRIRTHIAQVGHYKWWLRKKTINIMLVVYKWCWPSWLWQVNDNSIR